MALVRILVDGYSLLHDWPEITSGRAPHTAAARDALVVALTRYSDATGTPVTVIFDGSGVQTGPSTTRSTRQVEILYSKAGQTADDMIERAAYRFKSYGDVLVVTNDIAERETVINFGGHAMSCGNFVSEYQSVLHEQGITLKEHNLRERSRFKRARH